MGSIPQEMRDRAAVTLQTLQTAERTEQEWQTLRSCLDAFDEAFQVGNAEALAYCCDALNGGSDMGAFRVRGANTWDRAKDPTVPPPEEIYELINKMVHALTGVNAAPGTKAAEKPQP